MERKTKRQKKIKQQNRKMRKIHKKYSLVAHVQLWLERHSKIASFMDGGIILLSILVSCMCCSGRHLSRNRIKKCPMSCQLL